MRTPKESFQVSGHSVAFAKLVSSESFDVACDYALLQMQSDMPSNTMPGLPTDMLVGFDANARMQGAARVLNILKTLHEVPKPPTQPKTDKLHY